LLRVITTIAIVTVVTTTPICKNHIELAC
jgi:hypothetical protein